LQWAFKAVMQAVLIFQGLRYQSRPLRFIAPGRMTWPLVGPQPWARRVWLTGEAKGADAGGGGMHRLVIEVDRQLYQQLENAAQAHHVSLEVECRRRLAALECQSRYVQAVLAEMRAEEEPQRAAGEQAT